MREIYIYLNSSSWLEEKPDATLQGRVTEKTDGYIQIEDDNGLTQIIALSRVFAIVF